MSNRKNKFLPDQVERDLILTELDSTMLVEAAAGTGKTTSMVGRMVALVAEDRCEQINALKGMTKLFPIYLAYCLDEGPDTLFFNHRPRKSAPHGFDFSTDAGEVTYAGCTVTFTALQFAFYMGFEEIYLIGVDFSYSIPESAKADKAYNVDIIDMDEDDVNHFNKDYFGKGYRWHEPQVEKMGRAYEEARRVTALNGVRIYNATKGGKLEVFERRDYDSLFS